MESAEKNVYAGQGVGFSKLWAQVGSQRTVAGGSPLPPNSGRSTWESKKNDSDQGRGWIGGTLKSGVLPRFSSSLYLKHKDSKLTQPLPGLKHRRPEEHTGE